MTVLYLDYLSDWFHFKHYEHALKMLLFGFSVESQKRNPSYSLFQ